MLVFRRRVTGSFRRKLGFLQFRIGGHSATGVAVRQIKHRIIQCVEAGQGHELEFVTHRSQLALKFRDRRAVEIFFPIERGRTIVGEELARELSVHGFGKTARLLQIGRTGFAPDEIGIRRVTARARNRRPSTSSSKKIS